MTKTLTESQWLKVFRQVSKKAQDDGGAMTRNEIALATGKCEKTVQKMLGEALRAGTVEVVWVPRRNMIGVVQQRPAYRPTKKGATNGGKNR